jgi:hypothetical protein
MLAGFMWLAFAFSGGKQNDDYGHGYGGYSRRKRAFDDDEGKAWIIEDQILFLYCKSIIYLLHISMYLYNFSICTHNIRIKM